MKLRETGISMTWSGNEVLNIQRRIGGNGCTWVFLMVSDTAAVIEGD